MNNLDLYNKVRVVPPEAQKPITGGRLKNMTDINPMWRIKTLTEAFGVCGIGWYYDIVSERLEDGANDEKVAFVKINLFVKVDGEWSKPIVGTGGSSFVAKEQKGLYVNDECFKMALTDAISISCKALGIGADIYWNKDRTKYDDDDKKVTEPKTEPKKDIPVPQDKPVDEKPLEKVLDTISPAQQKRLFAISNGNNDLVKEALKMKNLTSTSQIKKADYTSICKYIEDVVKANNEKDFQECDEPTPF